MNILQIIPNKGWGGGEKIVFELSQALEKQGDNVLVIIPDCPIVESQFADSALKYIKLEFKGPVGICGVRQLVKIIKDNDIQIVHTHIFKHAAVALLARALRGLNVKVIMTRHICKPGKKTLHYPALYKSLDKLIFVSRYARDVFHSSAPPISEAKIGVIHNSILTNKEFEVPFNETDGGRILARISTEQPSMVKIGYAGSISYLKGIDLVIRSLGALKRKGISNFHFFIAGRGNSVFMDELHELIKQEQLSENMSFIGFIEDTLSFYRAVDFAVSPSRIAEAGGPLSVLESMACRRTIIATESSSNEFIDDTIGGYIVPRDDSESLEVALSKLIINNDLPTEMGANAKLRFENEFTFERYLAEYIKLYKSLT